jgi:hypothetical protein
MPDMIAAKMRQIPEPGERWIDIVSDIWNKANINATATE